jgi:hypothetical protein
MTNYYRDVGALALYFLLSVCARAEVLWSQPMTVKGLIVIVYA